MSRRGCPQRRRRWRRGVARLRRADAAQRLVAAQHDSPAPRDRLHFTDPDVLTVELMNNGLR
jgi:hypothetical protein